MTPGSLSDRLDSDYAKAWRPNQGDSLIGEVQELSERDGSYGPYPIVTVMQENGEALAFHAFHTVAASQLAEQRPAIGDRIGIKYKGKATGSDGRGGYHNYRVVVDRPAGTSSIDWSKHGESEAVDGEPAAASSTVNDGDFQPAPRPAGDDDIPF
jgi:hypothetical protein